VTVALTPAERESRIRARFWAKVDRRGPDECWEWTGARYPAGYGRAVRDGRVVVAHRRAYEYAVGPIPDGMDLLHSCDNPPCVNPAHLRPGTDADNARDKVERGRAARMCGEESPAAKLTWGTVASIKDLRSRGVSYRRLGAMFGVTPRTVRLAATGQTWK